MTADRLQKAVEEVLNNKDRLGKGWWGVSCLYAGAVRQLANTEGFPPEPSPPLFPEIFDADVTKNLGANGLHEKLEAFARNLSEETQWSDPDAIAAVSRKIIRDFGRPLSEYLNYQITNTGFKFHDDIKCKDCCSDFRSSVTGGRANLGPSFRVQIDKERYLLVPSVISSNVSYETDKGFLEHDLRERFPSDGWNESASKTMPFVRVLKYDGEQKYRLFFLDGIWSEANRRLAKLDREKGLGCAAIPLHPSIEHKLETYSSETNNTFRISEGDENQWDSDWESHLDRCIQYCSQHEIAVVCLPELMMSPAIRHVLMDALSQCDNGFPILVAAGSWHEECSDGKYVNRMHVLGVTEPGKYECLFHHDKFQRFKYVKNGKKYTEGIQVGSGFSHLLTSIGILSFGVCKDWFACRPDALAKSTLELTQVYPMLGICASLTGSERSLSSTKDMFKDSESIFLFANACGPVRRKLRGGICCSFCSDSSRCDFSEQKYFDVRSCVAVPRIWTKVFANTEEEHIVETAGISQIKAPCSGSKSNNNMVAVAYYPV